MKVVHKNEPTPITVDECAVASIFKLDGSYFLRCNGDSILSEYVTCVDIVTGNIIKYDRKYMVDPVDAEVVIN